MNVLLINPNREHMPWPAVPVGLCTVASATERAGHDVEVLDLTFSADIAGDVARAVRRREPDVVGVTIRNIDNCNFESPVFYLPDIRDQVIRTARRAAPRARVVIGGSAVNVSPKDVLEFLEPDEAIVGEGEEALPAFLSALSQRQSVNAVQGVLARGGAGSGALPILDTGRLGRGEPPTGRALVRDLERGARSEAWRWVDLARYAKHGGPYSVQSRRGCALKCSYCVYNNIEGHAYRLRKPSEVVDEIAEAHEHGATAVDFVDSTFNLPISHARALCEELARRRLPVRLSTMGLNPAAVTDQLVSDMKRAGFTSVMCTPESASDATLKSLAKGFGRDKVVRAAQALRAGNLPTYWFFMIGAPGETIATVRETLAFCEEHVSPRDMVLFSTGIRVYAGTPLEQTCKELGWFSDDDPLFEPSWYLSPLLDLDELYSLLTRAAERHPNWMTNAETVISRRTAATIKGGLGLLGMKGPFWQHLPKVFDVLGRVGLRSRGLAEHKERVLANREIRHRR